MRIIGLTWVWDGDLYGKLDLESSVESTEYLFNGGFELGCDFWEYSPACPVTDQYVHTGQYSVMLYENWMEQTLASAIVVEDIADFGLWYYSGKDSNYVTIKFTDNDDITVYFSNTGGTWNYLDLTGTLPAGKHVSGIYLRGSAVGPTWVDDVVLNPV